MLKRIALTVACLIPSNLCTAQDWLIDVEMTEAELLATASQRQADGFLPTCVSARGPVGAGTFAAVWRRNPTNVPWEIHVGLTVPALAATVGSVGYRLSCLDAYGVNGVHYAAVLVDNAAAFGPTSYLANIDPANFTTVVQSQQALGREPIWVGAGGSGGAARMACVFSNTADPAVLHLDQDSTAFGDVLATDPALGNTFHNTASHDDGTGLRFHSVGYASSSATEGNLGVTPAELQALQRWMMVRNLVPISIDAWDDGSGPRFSIVHRAIDTSSVWRANGLDVPELASIDAAMQTYMQNGDVPTAVVAITRNGKLIFKRAYNFNATGLDAARPDSTSRIASMSKVITATAIMQLVDDGLLGLNQPIGTIPNLALPGWTAMSQQITVRQLLSHTSGLPNPGLIGDEPNIAAAAGQSLPAEPWMWVIDMASQQPFGTPNTSQSYSNFGFSLLGRIVEAVTGERYEDYTAREVWGAVGAGRFRVGDSHLDAQDADELPYVDDAPDAYGTSAFGDGARVPFVYGGFNMDMGDSVGSWNGSAAACARFLTAFDDPSNSPLLSSNAITESWSRPSIVPTGDYYGLAWQVKADTGARWHGGVLAGTRTFMCNRTDGINFVAMVGKSNPGAVGPNGADLYDTIDDALDAITVWPSPSLDLFDSTPEFRTYGEGCPGSNGVPGVRLAAGTRPSTGTEVATEIFSLPVGVPLALAAISLNYLPLNATVLGFPGCTVYPQAPILETVPVSGEEARWSIAIPASPNLVGTTVHMQGIGIDPTVTGSFVFSHGSALKIGS